MKTQDLLADLSCDYDRLGMDKWKRLNPVVYQEYLAYLETGQYPYLNAVVNYILPKLPPLSESQKDNLKTQVYNASHKYQESQRLEHRNKMLAEGWLLLNESVCQQAIDKNCKIELHGAVTNDWLTTQITGLYRPKKIEHGLRCGYFLVAPHKRNKGYWLGRLVGGGQSDCFCKIVKLSCKTG